MASASSSAYPPPSQAAAPSSSIAQLAPSSPNFARHVSAPSPEPKLIAVQQNSPGLSLEHIEQQPQISVSPDESILPPASSPRRPIPYASSLATRRPKPADWDWPSRPTSDWTAAEDAVLARAVYGKHEELGAGHEEPLAAVVRGVAVKGRTARQLEGRWTALVLEVGRAIGGSEDDDQDVGLDDHDQDGDYDWTPCEIYTLLRAVKNLGGVATSDNGGWVERDVRAAAWVLVRAACASDKGIVEVLRVWKAERRTDPLTIDIDDSTRTQFDDRAYASRRIALAAVAVAVQDKPTPVRGDMLESEAKADSDDSSSSVQQPWSSDEDDALCGLYTAGSTPDAIADEMNRSRRSVSSRLAILQCEGRIPCARAAPDVPKSRKPWTSQDDEQLLLWRQQGVPVRECAERLGRSKTAVEQHISILNSRRRTLTGHGTVTATFGASASAAPQPGAVAGPSEPPISSEASRKGERFTLEEDRLLLQLRAGGSSLKSIDEALRRTPGSAANRLYFIKGKNVEGQLGQGALGSPSPASAPPPRSTSSIQPPPLDLPPPPTHLAAPVQAPRPGAPLPPPFAPAILPPYTDNDDNLIASYLQLGRGYDAMAAVLGRSKKSIIRRVGKKRAEWIQDGRLAAASTPSTATPAPNAPQPLPAPAAPAPAPLAALAPPSSSAIAPLVTSEVDTSASTTQPVQAAADRPRLPLPSASTSATTHPLAASSAVPVTPCRRPSSIQSTASQGAAKRRRVESPSPSQLALGPRPAAAVAVVDEVPRWRRPAPLSGPKYARVLEAARRLSEPFVVAE